ncbi:hypothetical protein GUITHDRAFT_153615 [Guillardia theta CCMP2712]|uniref:Uncharacterized protein n=1 Tax=Guillardia theta (strain CCMP2712) TaxID=905079 RepID=L1J0V5_GUITC|nr:hypothetical protein GUITHDRAFT_153615 [Guillardia theta CCMP2712]EKX42158.1 hypothetical protein GUITHDRAFT_153615 [Guillardia theta CCMP2712]|eukprot:XP_005829138.1 hypothetical protein GUITHDRAFT_153615 [Guillardia theta CCMP2712]
MPQTKRTSSRYFSILCEPRGKDQPPLRTSKDKNTAELQGKILVSSTADFQSIMKCILTQDCSKDDVSMVQGSSRKQLDITTQKLRARLACAASPRTPLTATQATEINHPRIRSVKFCVPHDLRMSFAMKISKTQEQRHPKDGTSSRFQQAILGPTANRKRTVMQSQRKKPLVSVEN